MITRAIALYMDNVLCKLQATYFLGGSALIQDMITMFVNSMI